MTHKQLAFQTAAFGMIQKLEKRNIEGYFFEDSASCVDAIMQMMPPDSVVAWGGSETLKETGLMAALQSSPLTLIDRSQAKTPAEAREVYLKTVMSNYFFMSTNAITLEGELVNIDGNANRLACLLHGPEHVMIIVGMNKVVADVSGAVARIRNIASPANAKRLDRQTPCQHTGRCGDCLSPDCMCNHIVVTRRSGHPGRIKLFFIAEELGY